MPTLTQSDTAKGITPQPFPAQAGELIAHRAEVTIPADVAANDVFELLMIPPGCRPVMVILDSDDLDSDATPAITFDVGFMSGTPGVDDDTRTVAAEFFAGAVAGQTGVASIWPTLKTHFRQAKSDSLRSIGVKCAVAPDVGVAGTLGLTAFYVAE